MDDLGIKLHPVKKLQLWQAIKKTVFAKMDNNVISPERADEILGNLKPRIVEIISPKQAKEFYLALPQMYAELTPVSNKFEIQEAEALDKVLTLLLDEIMDKQDFDLASELMEKIQNSDDHKKLINELQSKFPAEFKICLKRFSQKALLTKQEAQSILENSECFYDVENTGVSLDIEGDKWVMSKSGCGGVCTVDKYSEEVYVDVNPMCTSAL